jgi:hypothetical protein
LAIFATVVDPLTGDTKSRTPKNSATFEKRSPSHLGEFESLIVIEGRRLSHEREECEVGSDELEVEGHQVLSGEVFQKGPCSMCNRQSTKNDTQRIASRVVTGECCAEVAVPRGNV